MKTNELNNLVENIIQNEVKKTIIESVGGNKNEVFHIMCDNQPVDTFSNEDEAKHHLNIYKKNHPEKEFIIEKSTYESHDDMIDKLDEMGEELEEQNINENMEKKSFKVKSLAEAILHAKENGIKKINVAGKSYDVSEAWKTLHEEEGAPCPKCGEVVCECDEIKEDKFDLGKAIDKLKKEDDSEEECQECGKGKYELPEGFDEYVKKMGTDTKTSEKDRIVKEPETVTESKSKKIRLKETDFINLVTKMVNEAINTGSGNGVPGISVTKKAQNGSKKENDEYAKEVEKKMKDYLSFDGNDNPEFPNQIGGDKMAVQNGEEEEEIVDDNRGRMMVDINYDNEPSETFKKRADDALNGSSKMGNPKDAANTVPSKLGKKIKKEGEKLQKIKKEEPLYNKEPAPIRSVNETKTEIDSNIKEEFEKIKKLAGYNKKTQ